MNSFIVGSYVASLSLRKWDAENETAFYAQLKARPLIRGIEHGFYGTLHRYDDAWFLRNVDPKWKFLFTGIPGTMERLASDPNFGLASPDESGRKRAVEFIRTANDAVRRLNSSLGHQAVLAMTVHSAPTARASTSAFTQSLIEIAGWDWDGAALHVEHCDAVRKDGAHAKGFLPLTDEITAIESARAEAPRTPVAAMLNWGRSVVEGRDANHVLSHIDALKTRELLKGFIFSGTTASAESPYGYFGDKHAPAPTVFGDTMLASESLMTPDQIRESLSALPFDSLDYLGFKVMPRPVDRDFSQSLALIDRMLEILRVNTA